MSGGFEYRVVPAPRVAPRIKGMREPAERFAIAVEEAINEAAREGWEYWRTDTLTMEARAGWLGGRTVGPQALLVFRRPLVEGAEDAPRDRRRAAPDPAPDPAPDSAPAAPSLTRRPDPFGLRAGLRPAPAREPERSAVTPLPPRPLAPRPAAEPPIERPAPSEPFALPPRPDRDGPDGKGGPGRPRLGGARRD